MAVPLNVDPELGRMIRAGRQQRGWTVDDMTERLGRFGTEGGAKGYVLGRTQIDRLEKGQRNLSAEEAWRLVEIFQEYDAWELLVRARAVDPESSEEFIQAITAEAERRRAFYGEGGNRRRSERLTTRPRMAAGRVASYPRGRNAATSPSVSDLPSSTTATLITSARRPAA